MRLKILQWNVWYKESADNIKRLVAEIDPDILCAQEITIRSKENPDRNVPEEIAQQQNYNYFYQPCLVRDDINMGNAIFSKLPILAKSHTYVQRADGTDSYEKEDRIYIETTIDTGSKALNIGTVHLSYIHGFELNEQKKSEINALQTEVAKHADSYILTGDMNTAPDSYLTELLGKNLKNIGPDFSEATWTTKPFSYNGFSASTLDWRLDHAFGTADITVISAEVVQTEFSDHLPLLITVEV
jgi:endonuclease/exonuclease/phosphatase family metal-dependent hydrolase